MTLRILMTADAVGGVWSYALDLARGLASHGAETLLAVTGPSPNPDQHRAAASIPSLSLIDTGLPLDWLVETPQEVARAGAAIMRLARASGVDLIHLNTPALAAAHRDEGPEAIPVVATAHSCVASWWDAVGSGPLPESFRWRTDLHGAGLRAADRTIAPSASFAEATQLRYGVRPTVVYNGRAALSPAAERPIKDAAAQPVEDAAITVGRLWDKGKNLRVLDRAAAHLSVPLFAAGPTEGPNGDSIRFDHARPLRTLSEAALGARLAGRPVFLSSALYEPFGLAVLEAAASGCALVLSDIPTFRELWEGCATFVAPNDDRAFAAAVEALIANPAIRLARGETARTRAGRFTPEASAAGTLAVYRTLLPSGPALAASSAVAA